MWDYDVTKIDIPIMLISGEGGGDDWVLTLEQLQTIYNKITSSKMMMRRIETVHNEMLYAPNGYVMAWFMWQLQNDAEAAKAFVGNAPEVLSNPLYVNQQINLE